MNPADSKLVPADSDADFAEAIQWTMVRNYSFSEALHGNIQEMIEGLREFQPRCTQVISPEGVLSGAGSAVILGANAKSRSSSFLLNAVSGSNYVTP